MLFDMFVDHDLESQTGKNVVDESEITNGLSHSMQVDYICIDSDGLESRNDSDEENEVKNFPQSDSKWESEDPNFRLGLIFSSKKEAKFAIETYNIKEGKAIKFTKNDNIRLWAKCKHDDCLWMIYVAKLSNDRYWQVRTLYRKHINCFWDYTNKSINSSWLGKKFVKRFTTNPKLGTKEIRKEVCMTLKANLSRKMAYLAKRNELQLVQRTTEEQFSRIRNYCAELKRSDEGATVVLKFTTVSLLRSYTDARRRMGPSLSSPVNSVLKPNSSQGSISKK